MNADFEGGEFIFTEMDAKTVTVSWCCGPKAVPQQSMLRALGFPGQPVAPTLQTAHTKPCCRGAQTICSLPKGLGKQETCRLGVFPFPVQAEGWLVVVPAWRTAELPPHLVVKHELVPPYRCSA